MTRPITERMAEAKAKMLAREERGWRRTPKAFYLKRSDHAEFMAGNPPLIDATFRCSPSREHGFDGLPVRKASGLTYERGPSRLYSEAGTSMGVPVE